MAYTRSFWRRIGAVLFDLSIAHVFIALLFGWWMLSLDSPIRLTGSIVYLRICQDAKPKSDGALAQWDNVKICNTTSDFLFPNKEMTLQKITKSGIVTYTRDERFYLDSAGKLAAIIRIDFFVFLVWWFGASFYEASRWQATPGKRVFGLEVESGELGRASFLQSMARNGLKLSFMLAFMLGEFLVDLHSHSIWLQAVATHGNYNPALLEPWGILRQVVYLAIGIANAILVGSVFWPWKAMGRGLYDRIAGTKVMLP